MSQTHGSQQAPEAVWRAAVERATAAAEAAQREAAQLREQSEASLLRCNSLELRARARGCCGGSHMPAASHSPRHTRVQRVKQDPHHISVCMQATQAAMKRDRAEALLRREVGEKVAKLLDSKVAPSTWRGRAQTIALLRERVRALHEQYAGAGAAAAATQPAGAVAAAAQSDAPPSAEPAALPKAAPRDRHDMQHRAHLAAMRSSAQVKLF